MYYTKVDFIKNPYLSNLLLFQHHLENSITTHSKKVFHHQFLNLLA